MVVRRPHTQSSILLLLREQLCFCVSCFSTHTTTQHRNTKKNKEKTPVTCHIISSAAVILLVRWACPKDFHNTIACARATIYALYAKYVGNKENKLKSYHVEPNKEHAFSPLSPRAPRNPREGSRSEPGGSVGDLEVPVGRIQVRIQGAQQRGQYSCCFSSAAGSLALPQ